MNIQDNFCIFCGIDMECVEEEQTDFHYFKYKNKYYQKDFCFCNDCIDEFKIEYLGKDLGGTEIFALEIDKDNITIIQTKRKKIDFNTSSKIKTKAQVLQIIKEI